MKTTVIGIADHYRATCRRIAKETGATCRIHTAKGELCATFTSDDQYAAKAAANLLLKAMSDD